MWGSANFTFSDPPPYRSWPYEMTRLERLAHRAGMSDEELRLRLIEEIERRQRDGVESRGRNQAETAP